LLHILKKMGGVVSVLLRHFFVVDDKHIRVHGGNGSVRPAENLKCSIYDLICLNDVLVVAGYKMQVDATF
jgi:hypothetical protein